MDINFTGERFIPGKSSKKIEEDHLSRYDFASKFVKDKRVLDIACGVGYGSKILSDAGALIVDGVDISKESIDFAEFHYLQANVSFIRANILEYSSDAKYDVIICFETIEHVENYHKVLKNLERLLMIGGKLIISSPNRPITSPHCRTINDKPSGFHVQEFTIEELATELKNCGFIVENNIYGQRQQRYLPSRLLRKVYNIIFKPYKKFSSMVTPVVNRVPRYFILIAYKQ